MPYTPRPIILEGKHPADVVDYALDFTDWLPGVDALSSITNVTADAGITVGSSPAATITGKTVVFWGGGGTTGVTYNVEVKVITTGGRTLVADAQITITDPTP